MILSQKKRAVIDLITKDYKRIILSLPYDLKYLEFLNQLLSECLWSWCKYVLEIFYLQMLPESPVDHLQMYTMEVKSASEHYSESVFMKEYTCSSTGSVVCTKNYCTSLVTFSVSSDFFSEYSSRNLLPFDS